MREHTRKHHTEKNAHLGMAKKVDLPLREIDLPISVDEFIKECFGNLPQWAVALRGLRNREGLTQEALGEVLGTPQTNISKMETGKRPIGKNLAKRLAELFKIDYRIFL